MDKLIGFVAYITFTFMMVSVVVVVGAVTDTVFTVLMGAVMIWTQGFIIYDFFTTE